MSGYSGQIPDTEPARIWQDSAACIGEDPELFHAGERNPHAIEEARAICNRCTVKAGCLRAAYQEGDEYGLRAGLTPRQRGAFLRKTDGDIGRAIVAALETTELVLQQIYAHHAKPVSGGHVVWTDHRHFITVRGKPYTVHVLAWIALYGVAPVGHVKRSCDVEGCVAKACLTDRWMRDRADAERKTVTA